MKKFLAAMKQDQPTATQVAQELRQALSSKLSLDFLLGVGGRGNKAGVFNSSGEIPEEDALCERIGAPPPGYLDYRELVGEMVRSADEAFAKLIASNQPGSDLERHLLLICGWTYGGSANIPTPKSAMNRIRAILSGQLSPYNKNWLRWFFYAAGRCFSSEHDVALIANRVAKDLRTNPLGAPYDRAKALALILAYRPDAALALTQGVASPVFDAAIEIMSANRNNVSKTFYSAAFLLMGLLRYRRKDPTFLDPRLPETQDRIGRVKEIFERIVAATGEQRRDARRLGDQMIDFIDAKAVNVPIFRELDQRSD
jgi:hypothetical protein